MAGAFRLGEGEGGAGGFESAEGLVAAAVFSRSRVSHEVGYALGEPGAGRLHPGVGEGVGEDSLRAGRSGAAVAEGGGEESAGFERSVGGVGEIEEGELGAGTLAEPALEEWGDGGSGGGPGGEGGLVVREGPEACVGGGVGGADGDEKAGSLKAEGFRCRCQRWRRRRLRIGACGISDGEREGWPLMRATVGALAVGEFDGEAEAEVGAGEAKLVLADLVEEAGAVAEDDGNAGDGIPDDVAEAAQAGEGGMIGPSQSGGPCLQGCRWRAGAGR